MFWAIFLFATWTMIFPIGKMTLQFAPPVFLTGARMIFAGILLLSYMAIRRKKIFDISKKQFFAIVLFAILSVYFCNIFEFWGLQYLSSAKACFIYSLTPFFTAFFSYIHFKEKMNSKKWIGMIIGFLGILPVIALESSQEISKKGFLPEIALILATLCCVYGMVVLRMVVKKDKSISMIKVNGIGMFIGGIFAVVHSFFVDTWAPFPVSSTNYVNVFQGLIFLTLISNVLCYSLYGHLLKKFTATFLSFVGLLSPIFASINGWLILGEKPSILVLISTLIVMIGLYIVYQEEIKLGYIQKRKPIKNP